MVGLLLLDCGRLAYARHEGWGYVSGNLYARAAPEKVEIAEEYSVTQEISTNPVWEPGPAEGRVEIVVPYDGEKYFTREAADDVKKGIQTRTGEGTAVVGQLLLSDYARTGELRSVMRLHRNSGVIPIEVPVPTVAEGLDYLSADRMACLISYDYRPEDPEIRPIQLDVELRDPDTMTLAIVDYLTRSGDVTLPDAIGWLRQNSGFTGGLELNMSVQLDIPVKPHDADLSPVIKLMSVEWPAITSLSSTTLVLSEAVSADGNGDVPHSVRYNPILRRLEWEDIPMADAEKDDKAGSEEDDDTDDSARVKLFKSVDMRLRIAHPGELFGASSSIQDQTLKLHAEVEIPDYLLSGLEARLFDATGDWQRRTRPDARGDLARPKERYPWEPKLTTRVCIDTEYRMDDMFAKRTFKPYQQFVFDDVIPDESRITDILTVLRNAKFEIPLGDIRADPANLQWLLQATRRQGPDTLTLLIAVEGDKFNMDRTQIMGDNRIKVSRSKESGRITLSVLGTVPREHASLGSEINRLHQALRDRFRFLQTSRR
jgi:hypothetical protein